METNLTKLNLNSTYKLTNCKKVSGKIICFFIEKDEIPLERRLFQLIRRRCCSEIKSSLTAVSACRFGGIFGCGVLWDSVKY